LRRHDGKAILIGRWVGVLRALVPAAAGDSRIPYRTFVLWNITGAVVWAPTVIAVGYFAGDSWEKVNRVLGWGAIAIAALLVGAWFVVRQIRRRRNGAAGPDTSTRQLAPTGRDTGARTGKDSGGQHR
jgi:membrane-associated protein